MSVQIPQEKGSTLSQKTQKPNSGSVQEIL